MLKAGKNLYDLLGCIVIKLGCTLDELTGREVPAKEYQNSRQEAINRDFEILNEILEDAADASISAIAMALSGERMRAKGIRLVRSKGL